MNFSEQSTNVSVLLRRLNQLGSPVDSDNEAKRAGRWSRWHGATSGRRPKKLCPSSSLEVSPEGSSGMVKLDPGRNFGRDRTSYL